MAMDGGREGGKEYPIGAVIGGFVFERLLHLDPHAGNTGQLREGGRGGGREDG